MNKGLLNKEQKIEAVKLLAEHPVVMIGYGAEMYRDGYKKGCIEGSIALLAGIAVGAVIDKVVVPKIKEFINNKITTE